MRTYADYLTTMTVKALNTVARDMGLKRYSALRKADLVTLIDNAVAEIFPAILDTESPADHDTIAALIAEVATETPATPAQSVATVTFSATPAPTMDAVPTIAQTPSEAVSLDDLKDAYRNLRRTINGMGGKGATGQRRIKYVGRLRNLSTQLKAAGIAQPQYL
jgi:hypothetical protein